jgi:hypothetical protein
MFACLGIETRVHPYLLTSLWVQMLKRLAEVLESDKKSKLAAEFPEFGMPGASAYLAHADGDYDRAHDMLLEVQQHYKELVGSSSCQACLYGCYTFLLLPAVFHPATNSLALFLQAPIRSHL